MTIAISTHIYSQWDDSSENVKQMLKLFDKKIIFI